MDNKENPIRVRKRLQSETKVTNSNGLHTVSSKEFSYEVDVEQYYYTFIRMMSSFYEINCITDVKIMAYMCENCGFNTNQVKITAADRKKLVQLTGIKTQGISNAFVRLKGLGLITGGGGVFEVNPELWWRGSMATRKELLETIGLDIKIKFRKTLTNANGKLVDIETGEVVR